MSRPNISLRTKVKGFAVGFVLSLSTMVFLLPTPQALAAVCTDNGLPCNVTYFALGGISGGQHNLYYGNDWTWGGNPFLLGLRAYDPGTLTALIEARMGCTNNAQPGNTWLPNPNTQNSTSAAFTVLTMMGAPPGTPKNEACNQFWTWVNYIYQYDALGLIHWNEWKNTDGVNTRLTFQYGNDVSYYTDWGPPSSQSIVVYAPDGSGPLYAIKHDCGNPLGRLRGFQPLSYSLAPNVNINPPGATVEAGTPLSASYTVTNWPAQRVSDQANCTVYIIDRPGYVAGTPLPGPGDPAQNFICPPIGIGGTYTVPAGGAFTDFTAQANRTHCRRLVVTPANQAGASAAYETCKVVVSKPYAKVFGGDVAAGSGFGAACTQDTQAAFVGWNKRTAGAGAGTQYAGLALNVLQDFASAQINTGLATPPTDLSFSNQGTNAAGGLFGTSFGPSLPCVPDYFSQQPAGLPAQTSPINVSALTTGAYRATGPVTIRGGNVNPNTRVVLYVDGDVYIDNDITYTGSWNTASMPLFKLVVRGNIFIAGSTGGVDGNGVGRLDGIYIAQPDGVTAGTIYTCTNPATAFAPLSPLTTAFNLCNRKLVVNGSFNARHVELLRTTNTLAQSAAGETSGVNTASEVFNFSPAFWLAQPPDGTSTDTSSDTYDSIVSLPPVL